MAQQLTPGEIIELMKKGPCDPLIQDLGPYFFANYPGPPSGISPLSPYDYGVLVDTIERYATNEANKIIALNSPWRLKSPENIKLRDYYVPELINFVNCFLKLGGQDIRKLGGSVYPSYFDLCFRIFWLLGSAETKILGDKCNFDEIKSRINQIENDIIRPMNDQVLRDQNVDPYTPQQLNVGSRGGGTTLLGHAAFYGWLDVVRALIRKGVNVNLQGLSWHSPLWLAIGMIENKQNRRPIVELLLDSGADVNIKDIEGKSLLEHALEKQLPEDLVAEIQIKMI